MTRLENILNEWKEKEEVKSKLLREINSIFGSDPFDLSSRLKETKAIFAHAKSSLNPKLLAEFSISFSNQLLAFRKIKEADFVLNSLLAEDIEETSEAIIFLQLADIAIREYRWEECSRLLTEAKIIFEKHSDDIGKAKVENLWGILKGEKGEIDLAKDHFKLGLSTLGSANSPELTAELESNLAITEIIYHNFTSAEKYLKAGLNAFPDSEDNRWLAEMIHNYGMLHLHKKNYQQAIEDFNGAIDIAQENNQPEVLTLSKGAKGLALIYSGKIEEGLKVTEESLFLAEKLNDQFTIADDYKIIGVGERIRENYVEAEESLKKSYELNMKFNNNLNAAEAAFELAILYKQMLYNEKSTHWYNISANYFNGIGAENRLKNMEGTIRSI